jgi:hypothetical protein
MMGIIAGRNSTMMLIYSSAMRGAGRTGPFGIARRQVLRMFARVFDAPWSRGRSTGVCAALAIVAVWGAVAKERRAAASATPMALHIPAQPLAAALQAYGEQTGVQVLYESRSAAGQRSAVVDGTFTPEEALNAMLKGTELRVRYARPDAITLALPHPEPYPEKDLAPEGRPARADLSLGTLHVRASDDDDDASLHDYSESVQADVQKALEKNAKTRTGTYRVVLDLWIDRARTIERTRLHQSTGDPDRDAAVVAAIRGVIISRAAPANTLLPVRVAIVVRSLR